MRKIYGNFQLYKITGEKLVTKVSYTSLDKYQKSPYLQRVINHANKRSLFKQQQRSQKQQKIYKAEKEFTDDNDHLNKQEIVYVKHKEFLNNNQLPKIVSPLKFKEGQIKKYFKNDMEHHEMNNIDKQSNDVSMIENPIGWYSSTLQVSNKIKKLEPLQKSSKMHATLKTKAGTSGRQAKINQDISIIQTKMRFGLKLYCVCDGHGLNGHLVSAFIKIHLIKNLKSALKYVETAPFTDEMKQTITQCLAKTNEALLNSDINTELSGSTVIAVFIYMNKILSFNIGDSRAIIARQCFNGKKQDEQQMQNKIKQLNYSPNSFIANNSKNKHSNMYEWKIQQLSMDQKPERQDERQRIIKFGGRVFCQQSQKGQDLGPLRVWMKDLQMPGLAMTRSFGDKAGIKSGTNGIPEFIQHQITQSDKFIVVASDGVWQYLENNQVINLIIPFFIRDDIDQAAQRVVKIASQIWQRVSLSRDDITIIIVALNAPGK